MSLQVLLILQVGKVSQYIVRHIFKFFVKFLFILLI